MSPVKCQPFRLGLNVSNSTVVASARSPVENKAVFFHKTRPAEAMNTNSLDTGFTMVTAWKFMDKKNVFYESKVGK